jgi:multidrug efflux pump subunit AcrA (membrane-fusion protein)
MKTSTKIVIAIVGVAVVLGGGALAWKNGKGAAPAGNGRGVAEASERPLELIPPEIHTIKPRGLVDVVRFTGTTQPIDQTIVKSRVSGRLAEVLVREGDRVTEGQVLARFRDDRASGQIERASVGPGGRARRRALDRA